jgi:coenzyme F420-reducing hydrogenase delta subunit
MSNFNPVVVCFSCKFGWGYLADEHELVARLKNWVPIICSGKLDVKHIVDAFKYGADGVLILGCPEGDCHYQDGNLEIRKRILLLKQALRSYSIEPERVKLVLDRDPEGASIPAQIEKMRIEIQKLGPLNRTNISITGSGKYAA